MDRWNVIDHLPLKRVKFTDQSHPPTCWSLSSNKTSHHGGIIMIPHTNWKLQSLFYWQTWCGDFSSGGALENRKLRMVLCGRGSPTMPPSSFSSCSLDANNSRLWRINKLWLIFTECSSSYYRKYWSSDSGSSWCVLSLGMFNSELISRAKIL